MKHKIPVEQNEMLADGILAGARTKELSKES